MHTVPQLVHLSTFIVVLVAALAVVLALTAAALGAEAVLDRLRRRQSERHAREVAIR